MRVKRPRTGRAYEEDDDSDEDEVGVTRIGPRVFFYCEVSRQTVMRLHKHLHAAAAEAQARRQLTESSVIELYVSSDGGDLHAGLTAYDHIAASEVPVHTIADGFVASAATFLLLAGHRRFALPHAAILIHQLSAEMAGKFNELRDDMKNSRVTMRQVRQLYVRRTHLSRQEVDELLAKELQMTAQRALKHGFVEEVLQPNHKAASPVGAESLRKH